MAGVLRNLSAVQYNVEIPAGESQSLPFSFVLDMQPQDVVVSLLAVVGNPKGQVFQVEAHNGLASIVEPPTSIFDPQMYVAYKPPPPPASLNGRNQLIDMKQHLLVPLSDRSLRWHPLLRLQDLDRVPLPSGQARSSRRQEGQEACRGC